MKIYPDYVDTKIFLADREIDSLKRENIILETVNTEEKRLEKEEYFTDDNIGIFYGLIETRPYMRALNILAFHYCYDGKIKKAIEVSKKILKLNESDNLGVRYSLMCLYTYMEDEDSLLKLHKKYKENSFIMLMPLVIYYYKKCDYKEAKKHLKKVSEANNNIKKFLLGKSFKTKVPYGYYSHGDISEINIFFEQNEFLLNTVPNLDGFIIENID